jgi:hypothetical protein
MFLVISIQRPFNQMLKPQSFLEQNTIDSIHVFVHSCSVSSQSYRFVQYLMQLKSVFKLSTKYGQKAAEFVYVNTQNNKLLVFSVFVVL